MKILIPLLTVLLLGSQARSADLETPVKYTALLMLSEFAVMNIFELTDDDVSSSNFKNSMGHPKPERDDDSKLYNFVLHPMMGSETYLRAREGDLGVVGSVAFSMAASITWEYGIESWTEHPSVQDLMVTTGAGWILGELRYQLKRKCERNGIGSFLLDPIWSLVEYFNIGFVLGREEMVPVVGVRIKL